MSLYMSMSKNQTTICLLVAILCITGMVVMWSVMGYKYAIRRILHPAPINPYSLTPDQACIKEGGVPIDQESGDTMSSCERLK